MALMIYNRPMENDRQTQIRNLLLIASGKFKKKDIAIALDEEPSRLSEFFSGRRWSDAKLDKAEQWLRENDLYTEPRPPKENDISESPWDYIPDSEDWINKNCFLELSQDAYRTGITEYVHACHHAHDQLQQLVEMYGDLSGKIQGELSRRSNPKP